MSAPGITTAQGGGGPSAASRSVGVEMLVSSSLHNDIFMSWDVLRDLGVIPARFPEVPEEVCTQMVSGRHTVKTLMAEYADVFGEDLSGGRCLKGTMMVHLKDGPITP